jgi:hypothetical protein
MGTVMSFRVMTLATGVLSRVSNRMSRLVTMPTSLLSESVTGRPEIRYFFMTSMAFSIISSGRIVMGSTIMPLSWRLTLSTSSAWSSTDMLRWMIPRPPCWAMAMAIRDDVTVSMAALMTGTHRGMFRLRRVPTSASWGLTSEADGTMRTSSKVNPSLMSGSSMMPPCLISSSCGRGSWTGPASPSAPRLSRGRPRISGRIEGVRAARAAGAPLRRRPAG